MIPEPLKLNLLYEDKSILVLNKPKGLIVHPGPKTGTLVHGLLHYCNTLSTAGGEERPGIVHRLDKDTEGLMVIAKTNAAHNAIKEQFKSRTVVKKYYALIKGEPLEDEFIIDFPIAKKPARTGKIRISNIADEEVRDALTHIKVLARFNSTSFIEITPKTGRTHQIRIHLSHIGNPIVGDTLYSKKSNRKGQMLQAFHLSFIHPDTNQQLTFNLCPSSQFKMRKIHKLNEL